MLDSDTTQKFSFTLFRFTGPKGNRITETVCDFSVADGMRALVENSEKSLSSCCLRVQAYPLSRNR
jgi:hypothetical protein